ncbi:MAG: hypothetical protein QXO84_03660, partial [Candidatus Aenigmatarchaeota archaeon]
TETTTTTTTTTLPPTTTTETTTTTTTTTLPPTTTTIPPCIDTQPPAVQVMPYDDYIENIGGYLTLYDSHEGDIRFCINVSDDCGINSVEFGYKLDCDPWNYWLNYTSVNDTIYCFNLSKSQWTKYMDDTINWGYKVTDNSGKVTINYDVNYDSPIIVRDDDIEPPQFSNWQYKTIVSFNKTISVNVTIRDNSGVSSATLYYDYNSDNIPEGVTAPVIEGDRYYYQIPAPCDNNDKEVCREQGRAGVFMQFWIIAEDNDNDRENDSTSIRFTSLPIYIDPPEEDISLEDIFYIAAYSPSDSLVEVLEGRAINFYAYTNYPQDANLTYKWVWDGKEISQNKYKYSYQTDHRSAGEHTMTVYISNGEQTLSHSWKIRIIDKLCDYEMNEVKSSQNSKSSNYYGYYKVSSTSPSTTTTQIKTTTTLMTTTTQPKTTTTLKQTGLTGNFLLSKYISSVLIGITIFVIILFLIIRFYDNPRRKEEILLQRY